MDSKNLHDIIRDKAAAIVEDRMTVREDAREAMRPVFRLLMELQEAGAVRQVRQEFTEEDALTVTFAPAVRAQIIISCENPERLDRRILWTFAAVDSAAAQSNGIVNLKVATDGGVLDTNGQTAMSKVAEYVGEVQGRTDPIAGIDLPRE